jgi:hypothetical protein
VAPSRFAIFLSFSFVISCLQKVWTRKSLNAAAMPKPRPAIAKSKVYIEEACFPSFLFLVMARVPQLEETATKLQTALGQFTFEQAAVLPPPLEKIRELEAENASLMRENHDLHRMLSDTTADPGSRRQLIPFDVVPRTRNCDDALTDREYKRRKIDTNGDKYIVRLLVLSSPC